VIKAGDLVTLTVVPPWVAKLPEESRCVFRYCVARNYLVDEITPEGHLVLDVREVDGIFGGFMNDIRVEAEYVTLIT
jgi:hypothetical protein